VQVSIGADRECPVASIPTILQLSLSQKKNNTSIVKVPLMSATQLLSCKACATIRCFRALFGNDLDQVGSMLCNFLPESQQSSQNLVEVPLPTVVCTATPKNVWAIHGTCTGKPAQRRPSSVFCAHSHLIRSDQPKVSRL
jgi:hypothetical protein